eukprot:4065315-Amphidinium_carterae.1
MRLLMSMTIVVALDVVDPLDIDCAPVSIVSSRCSPSVSIGSAIGVVDEPDCPAVPVGTVPVGDVGLAAVDGLGADCGGCGAGAFKRGYCGLDTTLIVAPAPIVTPL